MGRMKFEGCIVFYQIGTVVGSRELCGRL